MLTNVVRIMNMSKTNTMKNLKDTKVVSLIAKTINLQIPNNSILTMATAQISTVHRLPAIATGNRFSVVVPRAFVILRTMMLDGWTQHSRITMRLQLPLLGRSYQPLKNSIEQEENLPLLKVKHSRSSIICQTSTLNSCSHNILLNHLSQSDQNHL